MASSLQRQPFAPVSSSRRMSVHESASNGVVVGKSPSRKRRSQSMGVVAEFKLGAGIVDEVDAENDRELSPRKKARRSLVPGRSILKPANSTGNIQDLLQAESNNTTNNFTTSLYQDDNDSENFTAFAATSNTVIAATAVVQTVSASSSQEDMDSGELTMNMMRRQSRRVSFAPSAQMREFFKDNEDESNAATSPANAPALPFLNVAAGLPQQQQPIPTIDESGVSAPSPSKSRRRSSVRGTGHRRRSSVANTELLVESLSSSASPSPSATPEPQPQPQPQAQASVSLPDNGETSGIMDMSMNIADTSEITTAFKSHFVFPRSRSSSAEPSHQPQEQEQEQEQPEKSFADSNASGMDLADDGEVTSAFAMNTHLFKSSSTTFTTSAGEEDSQNRRSSMSASTSGRRQSSPSKKVRTELYQRERQASESAYFSQAMDRQVPLGNAGIDEEEIERIRREKAKRGSMAFYNPPPDPKVTRLFAVHHSPELGADGEGRDDEGEMDMSMADTRRVSNVFAVAFGKTGQDEENDSAEVDSPSPAKPSTSASNSLYPSLDGLGGPVSMPSFGGMGKPASRTQGEDALAFLDDEEEDLLGPEAEEEESNDQPEQPEQQDPQVSEEAAQEIPEAEQYQPLPDPVFVPRASRLSVVPERFEEEEEEEDEDDDRTQDMDETAVFGSILSQRRLSIAHPGTLPPASHALQSPAKSLSPKKSAASPAKVSKIPRRQSLAVPSSSIAQDAPHQLFKSVPASSRQSISTIPKSTTTPIKPPPLSAPSPARQNLASGLTPNMKKLNDWSSAGGNAAPSSPAPAQSRATSNAPLTSEGVFDETAPHENDGDEDQQQQQDQDGQQAAAEIPALSLEQFLQVADMQFMDGLLSASQAGTGMSKGASRKSMASFGASGAGERVAPNGEVTLADQVIASGAAIPMMESLQMMVRELRGSLRENSQLMDALEEQVEDDQPALFAEYLASDDETRATMDQYFKLVRLFYRQETRQEWYDYRASVFDALCASYKQNLAGLQADKEIVNETRERLTSQLPELRNRAEELRKELEREKGRQKELESCDQEHLKELREGLAEQNATLEDYKRDNAEADSHLQRLNEKVADYESQTQEAKQGIAQSKRVCDEVRFYTRSEVYRLQDELELLQYLHSWRLVQFDATRIELCHREELAVTLLLKSGGVVEDFEIVLLDSKQDAANDMRRTMSGFLYDRLKAQLTDVEGTTAKELLRRIGNLWTSARRLRAELLLVNLQYPLSISLFTKKSRSGPFLRATARVYAAAARSEFNVVFEMTGEEMVCDNLNNATEGVGVNVEVKYGQVDRDELVYIVRDRVSQPGPRALLEACQDAEAKYA